MSERRAHIERITKETKIIMDLDLDGSGQADIHTGIGFFDHMLNSFARHGFFDLKCQVEGDLEVSGRPYLVCDLPFTVEKVGGFDTEMVREFFYAVSYSAAMNLHLKLMHGVNNHHIMEAAFKAFAKALDEAVSYDSRITDVLSTKGSL